MTPVDIAQNVVIGMLFIINVVLILHITTEFATWAAHRERFDVVSQRLDFLGKRLSILEDEERERRHKTTSAEKKPRKSS